MRSAVVVGEDSIRALAVAAGAAPADIEWRTRAGLGYPMARFHAGGVEHFAATPRPELAMRCTVADNAPRSACLRRFDAVATGGPPAGVRFVGADMSAAGIPLHVPDGCQMQGPVRIVCPSGALDWRDDARPGYLDAYGTALVGLGFEVAETVRTTCRVRTTDGEARIFVARKDGVAFVTLLCEVPYEGTTSIVQCIGYDPRTAQSVPQPCDQALVHVPTVADR